MGQDSASPCAGTCKIYCATLLLKSNTYGYRLCHVSSFDDEEGVSHGNPMLSDWFLGNTRLYCGTQTQRYSTFALTYEQQKTRDSNRPISSCRCFGTQTSLSVMDDGS
jgi:hypothetical protein